MTDFFFPAGSPNMSDVMVTASALIGGVIAWRQKNKDEQLKARDDTIAFQQERIKYLQEQLAECEEQKRV